MDVNRNVRLRKSHGRHAGSLVSRLSEGDCGLVDGSWTVSRRMPQHEFGYSRQALKGNPALVCRTGARKEARLF